MTKTLPWSQLALATLVGCAATTSYVYSPQDASYWADGYPGAATSVPPEAPRGKVEVTSFGVTEITPAGTAALTVLHVRLAVTNEEDATPWTLSTTDQLVEIAGEGRSQPIFVNTDVRTLPLVTIAQRERRVLDFYYPLPATMSTEDDLPKFDFLWEIVMPSRTYASRTYFRRLEQEPAPIHSSLILYSGWAPVWWHDPFHPRLVFVHHRPGIVHRTGSVIVTRPPRGQYRAIRDHRR